MNDYLLSSVVYSKKDEIQSSLVKFSLTIAQALAVLETLKYKILIVIDDHFKLIATITDGDIRRGLISGISLDCKISTLCTNNPIFVIEDSNRKELLNLFRLHLLTYIPAVNIDRVVQGLYHIDIILNKEDIDQIMVIMAGGLGTRLLPLTHDCPKPMLLLGEKPMLERILLRAKSYGFTKFIISLGHLGHQIVDYFSNGSEFGVSIHYIHESNRLGTCGSLSYLTYNEPFDFILTNSDVLSNINYKVLLDEHRTNCADLTIATRLHEYVNPFGEVLCIENKVIEIKEKPIYKSHVNMGIYALNSSVLDLLKNGEFCDMPDLILRVINRGNCVNAFHTTDDWLDVGRPSDYEKAKMIFD